jgi:hypothetical protein
VARDDIAYPALTQAAAFICRENQCGVPIFAGETLRASIAKATGADGELKRVAPKASGLKVGTGG